MNDKKSLFNYKQAFEQPYLFVIKWDWFPFFNGIHSITPWVIAFVILLLLLVPLRFISIFLIDFLSIFGLTMLSPLIVYLGIPFWVAKVLKSVKKDGKPIWKYLPSFFNYYLTYIVKKQIRYKGRIQEMSLDKVTYKVKIIRK